MSPAEERVRMEPWARAFEAVYGWGPVFEDFSNEVEGGFTITLRPAVEPIELLGSTGHFRHRPAMTEHVKRMGFGWTEANRVVTMPSPETFNALVERCVPKGAGFRVDVHDDPRGIMALGPFLLSYLAGSVPAHVAGGTLYAAVLANPKGAPHRGDLRFHFASFGHDLTVHALNYHLVPRACIEAFRARIEAAMPDRVAAWRAPASPGPLTLTTFYDNDVNRYCYGVWSRSESPDDFARRFAEPRHFDQLLACLDRRIDETLRGLGDVPSGDTRDLAPLAACEFTVSG